MLANSGAAKFVIIRFLVDMIHKENVSLPNQIDTDTHTQTHV